MTDLALDPETTALILIDLQNAIVARDCAPHTTASVVKNAPRWHRPCATGAR